MKKILLLAMVALLARGIVLTNSYAQQVAALNSQLPNLTYREGGDSYIKLSDGVMTEGKGGYRSASLTDRILNADFNNDGRPDAAVVLFVIYDGIGYFSNILFVVLSDPVNGPVVTNGIHIGMATYKIDLFSLDADMKKIKVGYMSRLPGQPKAALPTVPTLLTFEVKDSKLVSSEKTLETACYNSWIETVTTPPVTVVCAPKTVLKDGKCVAVSEQCKTWDSTSGDCLSCYDGYTLESGACTIKSGVPTNPGTCPFRTVSKNGECVAVSDQCNTWDNTTGDCLTCYGGYTLSAGKCIV